MAICIKYMTSFYNFTLISRGMERLHWCWVHGLQKKPPWLNFWLSKEPTSMLLPRYDLNCIICIQTVKTSCIKWNIFIITPCTYILLGFVYGRMNATKKKQLLCERKFLRYDRCYSFLLKYNNRPFTHDSLECALGNPHWSTSLETMLMCFHCFYTSGYNLYM